MSDQGDTGQWRPATSQNDHHSVPEDTTGPLPAVSEDEDEAPGFPSAGSSESWSATADDDAPTGGFPAVSSSDEPYSSSDESFSSSDEPFSPLSRSPFEPVSRTERRAFDLPPEPDPETGQDSDDGTTPAFGTQVQGARPARSSFGRNAFDEPEPGAETSFGEPSFGSGASSFGARSFGDFGSTPFDDRPEASYGPGAAMPETGAPDSDSAADAPGGSVPPPRPPAAKGVSAEDEADENDFFASDDHPPMWDKVVAPSGPPPKPGKPSSGNLRLPDWMRDEDGGASGGAARPPVEDEDDGRSRRPMFVGVGLLLVGLVAAGGAYVVKGGGNGRTSDAAAPSRSTTSSSPSATHSAQNAEPQKPLPRFRGTHTKVAGRITDPRSGLSYPRLAAPWAAPAKRSPMTELGFSASQFAVTEKAGGQPAYWARLMSAQLGGAAKGDYTGPGGERDAATRVAQMYEERLYGFRHKKRPLASQPLDIDGHKGWLVSDYLTFRRPGVKATGDVVTLALVDTGRKVPGILLMSVPNTNKKLWPDVNFVVRGLKVA